MHYKLRAFGHNHCEMYSVLTLHTKKLTRKICECMKVVALLHIIISQSERCINCIIHLCINHSGHFVNHL